jgi:hypothetical protein
MMAVLSTTGKTGKKMQCPLCKMECEKWYVLEPETGEEFLGLHEKLKSVENWLICDGCFKTVEKLIGCEIRIVSAKEAADFNNKQMRQKISKIAPKEELKSGKKCPFCGKNLNVRFEYQTDSNFWEMYHPFNSIIFYCSVCGPVWKIKAPFLDKPIGYFLNGTVIDFNNRIMLIKVAPFPDCMLDLILDSGCFWIQDGKTILMLEHACDQKVLESLGKMEIVEILVIGNRVVRLNAKSISEII